MWPNTRPETIPINGIDMATLPPVGPDLAKEASTVKGYSRWIAIAGLLCCTVCIAQLPQPATNQPSAVTASQPSPTASSSHDAYDIWKLIFSGMGAVGTLSVAVLAIFGQRIRNWIVRPRLALAVGETSPFIEKYEEEDASVAGAKRLVYQIRIEVRNTGREVARNCIVLCNNVNKERAGGAGYFPLRKFVPKQFVWTSKELRVDVAPQIPSYVNVAEISEATASVAGGGGVGPGTPSECLQILIEAEGVKGRFFRVENGKFLIPVVFYADNLPRALKSYLEICWRGAKVEDFSPANFQIRLLDRTQGDVILGGAQ